jgi:hypothetical protein
VGEKCNQQEVKKKGRRAVESRKADTQEVVFALHCTLRRNEKTGQSCSFVGWEGLGVEVVVWLSMVGGFCSSAQ